MGSVDRNYKVMHGVEFILLMLVMVAHTRIFNQLFIEKHGYTVTCGWCSLISLFCVLILRICVK